MHLYFNLLCCKIYSFKLLFECVFGLLKRLVESLLLFIEALSDFNTI